MRSPDESSTNAAAARFALARRFAKLRRRLRSALLFAPLALVWLADLSERGPRFLQFRFPDLAAYCSASLLSFALWLPLLLLAARRRGWIRHAALVFTPFAAAFLLGVQRYFHDQYAAYVTIDAASFGASVSTSVLHQVRADLPNFLRCVVPPAVVSVALLLAARRFLRVPRSQERIASAAVPLTITLALVLPCSYRQAQAATPDVLMLHALGRLAGAKLGIVPRAWASPSTRKPEYVPQSVARPTLPRNVILVISESQRADVVCSAYNPACDVSPAMNAALPNRIPLARLHANSSTTAISLAVLWSGMSPVDTDAVLKSAPLLWSYAHAAGCKTAYITSQNLDFANSRGFINDLPIDVRYDALDLDAAADIDLGAPDELASRQALVSLATLGEPFFAVVHYSNTHFPYRVDPDRSPFTPSTNSKDPDRNGEFFNHYKNANFLTDVAVGELVRGVRAASYGPRTVLMFTSDHGEAFREHSQLGHTGSVYDDEIHVPGWIDAPPGTLTSPERASLLRASLAFTFHVDFTPTILDLIGVWDAPEVQRFRTRMLGTSLLRGVTESPVPLTNCAALWTCPFRNWGMMRQGKKLEARAWDPAWHCFDLDADPKEKHDLGGAACGELSAHALQAFGHEPHDEF